MKENDVISASEAEQLVGKELFRDEWIGRLLEREKWLIRTYQHTTADSDEVAQVFRFDGARDSNMMSPRARSLAGW